MPKTNVKRHTRKGTKGVKRHTRKTPLKKTVPNRVHGTKPKYAETHSIIKKVGGGREDYGRFWFKGDALAETKRLHGKRRGRNPYYVVDAPNRYFDD